MSILDYEKAKKLGEKSYGHEVSRGRYPYLPALDYMLKNRDTFKTENLGVREIPIYLICGTLTLGRQEAFAKNYMPLLGEDSEFAAKWIHLLSYQENEGITDAVKAHEFMGRFYISEGNKRVSVLKYLGQPDILADITRILPPENSTTKEARIYREFMKFFDCTGIYGIYFSEEGCYSKLADMYGMDLESQWPDDVILLLKSGFYTFSRLYSEHCGEHVMTLGDSFMLYMEKFTPDSLLNDSDEAIRAKLGKIWPGHMTLLERLRKFCAELRSGAGGHEDSSGQ